MNYFYKKNLDLKKKKFFLGGGGGREGGWGRG